MAVLLMKDVLKSVTIIPGELSVMINGQMLMLKLCVDS